MFKYYEYEPESEGRRNLAAEDEAFSYKNVIDDLFVSSEGIKSYAFIEDMFNCSGMCKSSLFYYSTPMSSGRPMETCFFKLKESLNERAQHYARCLIVTSVAFLFIFFLHFGMYFRDPFDKKYYEEK